MTRTFISIGSNIEREHHIHVAMTELKKLGVHFEVSRIFEAEPVGFSGPNFYNCVVALETSLSLSVLQQTLKQLELDYGRAPDAKKNQSRTLDLDILLYGNVQQNSLPTLPRADIYKFAFVLWPMAEIAPDMKIPGEDRTILQLWNEFGTEQALWPVDVIFEGSHESL
ncbi:2-amino-4-hydroxy-6-hydroxymethyldihydropteridine diphosphokinase [Photobacterium sanguinicancri]|uniref:2-amino-4-hydroxy-6-hydroxymethyldihydropteridine diphosphokinase n=1 Tax=Photobacterium sanguinicancri TaxID=875932 RepID=A0ABX4G2U2_9GAMM|nr:2-amino-4-hydroxy-6-hydroxymethyldihydropteridine diphosphokinase [Photobacterium sanguinicancri]OZS45362.1 2-amino-4-hydroxy-6-hydroxymethyldihydropteridine diphosphokinase [Photobacterium sanguinicancri]